MFTCYETSNLIQSRSKCMFGKIDILNKHSALEKTIENKLGSLQNMNMKFNGMCIYIIEFINC